jgi:peptidoglycan hydrolase-like protein with peptidoglycan-binding domain
VQTLQVALGIEADGVFGFGTEKAVKRFQEKHGLKVDGIAGKQVWEALG